MPLYSLNTTYGGFLAEIHSQTLPASQLGGCFWLIAPRWLSREESSIHPKRLWGRRELHPHRPPPSFSYFCPSYTCSHPALTWQLCAGGVFIFILCDTKTDKTHRCSATRRNPLATTAKSRSASVWVTIPSFGSNRTTARISSWHPPHTPTRRRRLRPRHTWPPAPATRKPTHTAASPPCCRVPTRRLRTLLPPPLRRQRSRVR